MAPRISKATLDMRERVNRGLQLRATGMSYQAIAESPWKTGPGGKLFGGDRGNCHRELQKAYSEYVKEAAEEVRLQEIERLDRMFLGLVNKGAFKGNVAVVNSALNVMARRAKLIGLDAPTQIESKGDGGNFEIVFHPALNVKGMDVAEIEIDEEAAAPGE